MYTRSWIATAAMVFSLSAQATGTLQLTGFTYDPLSGGPGAGAVYDPAHRLTKVSVLNAPPTVGDYPGGGQMSGLLAGFSFEAFCVQIDIPVSFGPVYTDYVQVSDTVGFGATKAADLAKLITWASAGRNDDSAKSAAVQAAVWEIVHETGPSYGFTSGNLQASSANAATTTALNAIDWAAIASTTPTYTVGRLDGATQDLLIFHPIPEAGTLAMMLLGVAGFGAVVRKRRHG